MSNTYTQLYVQLIFAVQNRRALIQESFRNRLEKYICGIISNAKCKPLSIYCNPDHTHILVSLHPAISISDLTKQVKAKSSKFINDEKIISDYFQWQRGFGAFTYSHSQIDKVAKYILNQPNHHKNKNFKDEYLTILEKSKITYDERYLFQWFDN